MVVKKPVEPVEIIISPELRLAQVLAAAGERARQVRREQDLKTSEGRLAVRILGSLQRRAVTKAPEAAENGATEFEVASSAFFSTSEEAVRVKAMLEDWGGLPAVLREGEDASGKVVLLARFVLS